MKSFPAGALRKLSAITFLCGALTGCTIVPPVEEASQEYVQKRRELHGDITDAAEAWICRGISVYEWQRRYGVQSRAEAWQGLCETPDAVPLPSEPISP